VFKRSLLATVLVALVLPLATQAHTPTQATVFQPFRSNGTPTIPTRPKSGYCYTGSLAVNRNDAWRCFVKNFIFDPCFSSPAAHGVVVCPNADVNGGAEIHLTKRLPQSMADPGTPSIRNQPWDIEMTNGKHFVFSSGASNEVKGQRLNYFCATRCNYGLWGYPRRRSQPWTIAVAPYTAKSLHERRAIRHVWM
jgi:hypothetical protein